MDRQSPIHFDNGDSEILSKNLKSTKKVKFESTTEVFHHQPELEAELRTYRGAYFAQLLNSYRVKSVISPILEFHHRSSITRRNMLLGLNYSLAGTLAQTQRDALLHTQLGYQGWTLIKPETHTVNIYAENCVCLWWRLRPHTEYIHFVYTTHTSLCLCVLAEFRAKTPGICVQFSVAPPFSIVEATSLGENNETFVIRRTEWRPNEPPLCETRWSRDMQVWECGDNVFTLNQCPPSCSNYIA